MPQEVKILIPDIDTDESVDIKVVSGEKQLLEYRLEVFIYPEGKTQQSRAMFAKEKLEHYNKAYEVVEIGLDSRNRIPILFRKKLDE